MPLADIIRKIEETARAESEKVLLEADEKRLKIASDAKTEASLRKEQIIGEAKKRAERAGTLTKSRSDALRRQLILRDKQEMVASVFGEALARLRSMPAEEYRDVLIGSLRAFAAGNEVVTLGAEDQAKLGPSFVEAANTAMISAGKPGNLTFTYASSSLGGGYLLTSGGVSENLTFPTLVGRLRDDMEMEVARTLFA